MLKFINTVLCTHILRVNFITSPSCCITDFLRNTAKTIIAKLQSKVLIKRIWALSILQQSHKKTQFIISWSILLVVRIRASPRFYSRTKVKIFIFMYRAEISFIHQPASILQTVSVCVTVFKYFAGNRFECALIWVMTVTNAHFFKWKSFYDIMTSVRITFVAVAVKFSLTWLIKW